MLGRLLKFLRGNPDSYSTTLQDALTALGLDSPSANRGDKGLNVHMHIEVSNDEPVIYGRETIAVLSGDTLRFAIAEILDRPNLLQKFHSDTSRRVEKLHEYVNEPISR